LLKEQAIDTPPTVIRIDWTRNGTAGNFYHLTLSINPELLGFERDTETNWGRSSWHKSTSFNNSAKKQMIDALGAWSLQFAKQMDSALDKKQDAFLAIPSWRSVLDGQIKPEATTRKISLD
jgi:hypothetical protein